MPATQQPTPTTPGNPARIERSDPEQDVADLPPAAPAGKLAGTDLPTGATAPPSATPPAMSDDLPPRLPSRRPPEKHGTPVGVVLLYVALVAALGVLLLLAVSAYLG